MMRWRSFLRSARGGVSVITALSATALIGFAGFATDVGSVFLESRRLQGTADLAAVAAAQNPNDARLLAQQTVAANDWPTDTAMVTTTGVYTADRTLDVAQRFVPDTNAPNAARVQLTSSAPLFFGRLFVPSGRMTISRTATAAQTRWAAFQVGSRLASLNGGIENQVLSGLTGSSVSLSVMDYNALLSANVDLFSYVSALRTRLDLQAATFGDTLSHRVETSDALGAIADVLQQNGDHAAGAIRTLANAAAGAGSTTDLNQLIDLGPYENSSQSGLSGPTSFSVNAMDLATAIVGIAQGDRQVKLQLASGVPGIANVNVWLAIGQRPNHSPWLSITDDRDVVLKTAQMRLYIEATTPSSGALSGLAGVRVPVLVELASAQAKLSDVMCSIDKDRRAVTLSVDPAIGSLSLGEINLGQLNNFETDLSVSPANLIHVGAISVQGQAHVELGGEHWQDVSFSNGDISNGVVKTVSTQDAAQATISSLLGNTRLTVRAGGLGLSTPTLTSGVQGALSSVGAPLDALVNNLTALFGVRLGEADVRVNGVRCGGAALVA